MADYTPTRTRMTIEEYMALPETNQHMELINGELIIYGEEGMAPAPKDLHGESISVFHAFLAEHLPPRELRVSSTDVHIDGINVVRPDIVWVSSQTKQCVRGADGYLHGAPDFIIEVLSPATASRDRGFKFELYERCGVREYWLVDYESLFIEIYTLQAGKFQRLGLFIPGESFESPVLSGLKVEVEKLLE